MELGHGIASGDQREEVVIRIGENVPSCSSHATAASGGGEPPLHRLARYGDKLAIERELMGYTDSSDRLRSINEKSGSSGVAPLHLAAVHGHAEAVKCLLDHKADVDIADKNDNTPLHLAVMRGNLPTAEELVRAGAHLCKMNKEGMMPVSYCRTEGDMLERLLQHFPNFYSVRGKSVPSQKDARSSVIDKYKKSILHYAARFGQSSCNISRLLDCWASCGDLLDEEEDYKTFLAEAVKAGNAEAVKAVRKFGFLPADQPSNYDELLSSALLVPEMSPGSIERAELVLRELLQLGVPPGFQESRLTIESLIVEKLRLELERTSIMESKDAAGSPTAAVTTPSPAPTTPSPLTTEPGLTPPTAEPTQLTPAPAPARDQITSGLYTNELTFGDVSNFSSSLPTYLALYAKRHLAFEFMLDRPAPALTVNHWDEKRMRTCLHWAVVHGRRDIVEKLLGMKHAALLSPSLEDTDGKTALQLAFESKPLRDMRRRMLERGPAFKAHEEKLYKDREVYTAATNAILVGAVLVASVTYAGWLQPPVSQPDQFRRRSTKVFWAANSLAFMLALATVFVGIGALLPTPKKYVAGIVKLMRVSLVVAAFLLALSLVLALAAFSAAGFAVIPHEEYPTYRASISGTISSGGVLCAATFLSFAYQLYKLLPSGAVMAHSFHCRSFLSSCGPDPSRFVGRLGSSSSTSEGLPSLPATDLQDALRITLDIPKRQSSDSYLRTFIRSSSAKTSTVNQPV